MDFLHSHCFTCIKVFKCTKKPCEGESCAIIQCPWFCGSRFHGCKLKEHNLLCQNVRESCINASFGCPSVLLRSQRAKHLELCPASVISCTVEWNRWPICLKGKQNHLPFTRSSPQICQDQLDVSLALRDQGMLDQFMILPRRIQRLMRNCVTPRNPPVPLVPSLWNQNHSKKWKSMSSEDGLLNVSLDNSARQSVERSEASLLSFTSTDDESPWGRTRKPPGLLQSVCSQIFIKKKDQQQQSMESDSYGQILTVSAEKDDDDTLGDLSDSLDDSCASDSAFVCEEPAANAVSQAGPTPPAMPLLTNLGLDMSIQCIPRYLSKAKSMYTFVCAQDYRRDEYPSHYKDWHSDIQGGLDGWMEQRCPLARYGCSFSRRRLHPMGKGSRVVYSKTVESFGCQLSAVKDQDDVDRMSLCDLPFEVLRCIALRLDSFSLCHLSLTCRLLRDVCRSLVGSRGLVVMQWEKVARQGWRISHKKWVFSQAFTPVNSWGFEDGRNISNHMKTCRYNVR